jgi:hypothetical protein
LSFIATIWVVLMMAGGVAIGAIVVAGVLTATKDEQTQQVEIKREPEQTQQVEIKREPRDEQARPCSEVGIDPSLSMAEQKCAVHYEGR